MFRYIIDMIIFISALILNSQAYSQTTQPKSYSLLSVEEASIGWFKIVNYSNPLIPDVPKEEWSDHVQLNLKLKALTYGFSDSEWYYDAAYHKVTVVGLKMFNGIHLGPYLDIGWQHHSSHTADRQNSYKAEEKYLLYDGLGVRFNFIK